MPQELSSRQSLSQPLHKCKSVFRGKEVHRLWICKLILLSSTPINERGLKFPYATKKIRGVNAGGWFVLEPWITPSLFADYAKNHAAVDEHSLCQVLGKEEAHKRLKRHWDTWITKADFHDMASKGLNFVRIPIGYWSIIERPEDPYVQGAYQVMAKALDWAHEAGLKVMIDLHGGESRSTYPSIYADYEFQYLTSSLQ